MDTGYLEQGEVKQIITQLTDGSTWTAEIGLDGKLRLLEQLSEPDVSKKPKEFEDEDEEPEQEQEPEEAEPEQGEGEPQDGWGDAEAEEVEYDTADIDELLNKMEHRDMQGGEKQGKLPNYSRKLPKDLLLRSKDGAFKSRLSSVMLDNKYDRRTKGRTRGKLDMNRLYKIPTGSRSVFTQKESRKGKNYSVVIGVDRSSSMGDAGKDLLAAESVVFLTKQLTDIGINVGIVTYEQDVQVLKNIDNMKPNYKFIYGEIANSRGGTNDYPAMRKAYQMLSKAPEGKKIFIMLSDGSPGGYHDTPIKNLDGSLDTSLKPLNGNNINYNEKLHLHHLVKAQKNIESIGIGIRAGGWQVPDHEVIQDVKMLKKTIIKQLRKHIKRG